MKYIKVSQYIDGNVSHSIRIIDDGLADLEATNQKLQSLLTLTDQTTPDWMDNAVRKIISPVTINNLHNAMQVFEMITDRLNLCEAWKRKGWHVRPGSAVRTEEENMVVGGVQKDAKHKRGSHHLYGEALDFNVFDASDNMIPTDVVMREIVLNKIFPEWDEILSEGDHVHVGIFAKDSGYKNRMYVGKY